MRVVVLGGTGRIGAPLADAIAARGHDVLRASRASGVDALSGAGLDEALVGADAVVDALNIDTIRRKPAVGFFRRTAERVAAAAERQGVGHVIPISIWSANRPEGHGYGYYAAKAAQEAVYEAAPVPVTIVRSTQWYELAEMLLRAARFGRFAVVPHMIARPAAASAVAGAVAEVVEGAPRPEGVVIAGPEVRDLHDLASAIAAARGERVRLIGWNPPGMGVFAKGLLLPPAETVGVGPVFEEWLAAQ